MHKHIKNIECKTALISLEKEQPYLDILYFFFYKRKTMYYVKADGRAETQTSFVNHSVHRRSYCYHTGPN